MDSNNNTKLATDYLPYIPTEDIFRELEKRYDNYVFVFNRPGRTSSFKEVDVHLYGYTIELLGLADYARLFIGRIAKGIVNEQFRDE